MKAYGHTRKDKQECEYGCCGTKSLPQKNCRGLVDKAKRKKARQSSKVEIKKEVEEV